MTAQSVAVSSKPRVAGSAVPARPVSTTGKVGTQAAALHIRFSHSAKRSYRQARRRAHIYGETTYKGQRHTAATLQALHGVPAEPRQAVCYPVPQGQRLSVLTYNAGGLTAGSWQELQAWLSTQSFQVVVVQETHWTTESMFEVAGWHCINTACTSTDRYAGEMVMISHRLAGPEMIRHAALVEGRVLQVKITAAEGTNAAIDIVAVYQHVWRSGLSVEENHKCRGLVWDSIDDILHQLPQRNTVVLLGDLNTRPPQSSGVGQAIPRHTGKREPDQPRLANLISRHSLTALNTWSWRMPHTHQHLDAKTLIDYVFVRAHLADRTARRSRPLHDAPLAEWKTSKHLPVEASLRLMQYWHHRRETHRQRFDAQALQHAVRHNTNAVRDMRAHIEQVEGSLVTSVGCHL